MAGRFGLCCSSSSSLFAVVGLGVLGIAGFNTLRTGCPTCFTVAKAPEAAVASPVSHETGADEACPLGCSGEKAEMVMAAGEAGAEAESCCAGEVAEAEKAADCCAGEEAEKTAAEPAGEAGGA